MSFLSAGVLDLITIIVFALFVFIGVKRGFVKELANTAGWALSLLIAYIVSEPVAAAIGTETSTDSEFIQLIIRVIAFIVLFIVAKIIIRAIGSLLNALVEKIPVIGALNKILGGAFGACEGALLVLVLTMILRLYALGTDTVVPADDTFIYHYFWDLFV